MAAALLTLLLAMSAPSQAERDVALAAAADRFRAACPSFISEAGSDRSHALSRKGDVRALRCLLLGYSWLDEGATPCGQDDFIRRRLSLAYALWRITGEGRDRAEDIAACMTVDAVSYALLYDRFGGDKVPAPAQDQCAEIDVDDPAYAFIRLARDYDGDHDCPG